MNIMIAVIRTRENTGSEQQSAGMTNPDANLFSVCACVSMCRFVYTHVLVYVEARAQS